MTRGVVLTGASGGIGRALAERLAAPGTTLLLIGRDAGRLEETRDRVLARGGAAETLILDVLDAAGLDRALTAFDARAPIEMAIANAGVSSGLHLDGALETADEARRTVEIDLIGAMNTIWPLIAPMRARKSGRIVLVSSLAGLRPLPEMPAYSAAKAGLIALGQALRATLAADGVAVTTICPGFVASPMSARHIGPKPFEISAERAAGIILRGVARGRRVTFPWQMALLVALERLAPPAIGEIGAKLFSARIAPEKND